MPFQLISDSAPGGRCVASCQLSSRRPLMTSRLRRLRNAHHKIAGEPPRFRIASHCSIASDDDDDDDQQQPRNYTLRPDFATAERRSKPAILVVFLALAYHLPSEIIQWLAHNTSLSRSSTTTTKLEFLLRPSLARRVKMAAAAAAKTYNIILLRSMIIMVSRRGAITRASGN